jgi:LmbE family N-acetylglucosaminyl deacetylase
MKPSASLALALLVATASAQTPTANQTPATSPTSDSASRSAAPFADPANLRGERPRARDGRELPIDQGASGLQQLLRKLNTRASILNIVAHPDDEDGGMLTTYARGFGARVADLSLTRGEGGQNAITGDFEDALGLLRTQELLANDRYVGVDQFFGTEVDFGFSKTKAEAFAKWTHERVLYDAVRAIRLYRPLVITSTWIGGVTDGHGQHQVSGEIAQEAFVAAGDPKVFPELTREGILPWQPLRIYARVPMQSISARGLFDYATGQFTPARFTNYVTGQVSTTPPSTDVLVHEGTPDPLITPAGAIPSDLPPSLTKDSPSAPLSYIQFARIGLGLQKSQIGPGFRNAPTGAFDVAYHLYGSRTPTPPQTSRHNEVPQGSRSEQISQAPQHEQVPQGFSLGSHSHFKRVGFSPQGMPSSAVADPNFFTGIDTSILSIQDLAPNAFPTDMLSDIARGIQAATEQFDPAHPEKIAPALAASLKIMDELIPEVEQGTGDPIGKASALHELRIKRVQLNDALALALSPKFDATTDKADLLIGSRISVEVSVSEKRGSQRLSMIELQSSKGISSLEMDRQALKDAQTTHSAKSNSEENRDQVNASLDLQTGLASTEPYFYRDNIEQPVYDLRDPTLRNAPSTPAPVEAWSRFNYNGVAFQIGRVVHSGPQAVSMVPPISISLASHAQVLPDGDHSILVHTYIYPAEKPAIEPKLALPNGWKSSVAIGDTDGPGEITLQIEPPRSRRSPIIAKASALSSNHESITQGYRPVGYGDLPRTNYFTPATDRIVPVDLKLPTKKSIAYLPGTGDAVPEALASIGLTPTMLSVADLTPSNLSKFDTVILGVRTYAAHPDLHGAPTQALLDYARNGGNVVVQYQTPEFTAEDAPYPLSLGSNEKVVDETAPVLLQSGSASGERLLEFPNKITPADFNGWTEERGHGFLSTWDAHYAAPTETHDPGVPAEGVLPQAPQRGGLVTAQVGKGRWTYVAFALYRQLPEAVPGAFRLFANLINP